MRFSYPLALILLCLSLVSYCAPHKGGNAKASLSTLHRTKANYVSISEAINPRSNGSGVLISSKLVLTCEHVLRNFSTMILVRRDPAKGEYRSATVLFKDPVYDLALLELDQPMENTPLLRTTENVQLGEQVHAHGTPYSLELTTLIGTVSEPNAKGRDILSPFIPYIQVQGIAYPGVSGGGVYNRHGKFLGINRASYGFSTETGIGFVIPWQVIRDFLNEEGSPIRWQMR